MSTLLAIPTSPLEREARPDEVRRTPLFFQSQGRWLFGFLRRRVSAPYSRHGILICSPVGHEQIHSYRTLRLLADALAEAGFSVFRFDYDGTGDSEGTEEDAARYATWLANVGDARLWMQSQGCERISLIGLRLGASLAADAASIMPVDDLVLWTPVVKGRAYLRELKAFSLAADGGAASKGPGEQLEAGGFILTEQTQRELNALNLLRIRPSFQRSLIVSRDDSAPDSTLLDHLRTLGTNVENIAVPGYVDMMEEPHFNEPPRQAIAAIVEWMVAGLRQEDRSEDVRSGDNPMTEEALIASTSTVSPPIREKVYRSGRNPELFGIISEPCGVVDRLPFVVLINSGSVHRVGPHRLYVALTRQLAARGFRCLRLDIRGLGDSLCSIRERENDPYPATAFQDVDLTLRNLQTRFGVESVVLMGLCSGAYAAFQSAAQLTTPALVESILINPMTFFWQEGMVPEKTPALQLKHYQDCIESAWQMSKWLRLLTGRSKLGIRGAMQALWKYGKLRDRIRRSTSFVEDDRTIVAAYPSHPRRQDLPGDLQRIVEAKRHLTCFFARSDPGYSILMLNAKQKVKQMRRAGQLDVHFISGADHTFSRRAPRQALMEGIVNHLWGRYALKS